ncbi:hypothetical protein RHSIM_Rhsim01G0020400 [Rhododendron simsii]|uniref:GRF-type domain-containing protein n=1 Tax=Rhododendron simsii TaxID=118357 RepID=A0A834LXN5_RHOSS|nr:hypothetical protein RHSIM_Rhsim01G0020400 [Rhododendron simsii]
MATSSSNSTANSRRKKVCKCGETPVLSTSWTDDNPSRRFFGCRNYYDGKPCNYFRWLDDEICDRGKIVIPQLRNENLKMKEDLLGTKEELLKMKE